MTEQNVQSKSQLAKLLATENISFQHSASAKTAYFDVKNRLLVLPVWQNISTDLYDMLIVHEVGHALDTPADGWLGAIKNISLKVHGKENSRYSGAIKGFLNVIEDARIDKRQKRRYPGSRRNYINGLKELFNRDFFGLKARNINDMSFIDRMNVYFKGGYAMGIQFSKEEMPLLKKVEAAETFEEVVALTEEIYKFAKEKGEEQRLEQNDFRSMSGESDEEGDQDSGDFEYDDEDFDDEDESSDDQSSKKSSSKETDSDDADESEGETGIKPVDAAGGEEEEVDETDAISGKEGGSGDDDEYIPQAETERSWEENLSSLAGDDDTNYIYVELPKPDLKKIVDDFKIVLPQMTESLRRNVSDEWLKTKYEDLQKFKSEENGSISFMVKEFEAKKSAETYSKISIAKTGVIDTNKLHSYKYNDDIFRRLAITPNGKNHGFIMFLDWSGSMIDNFSKTVKQLISMTLFCKRVQIPFEVYSFRDLCDKEWGQGSYFSREDDQYSLGGFKLRNILSSRMKIQELNAAYLNLWCAGYRMYCDPFNGTPLNQAIISAEGLINQFRKANKLEVVNTIFLTDGDSNSVDGVIGDMRYPAKVKGNRYILRDDVTKKEYTLGRSYYDYGTTTNIFLRILKDRTDCNLIGFFLSNDTIRYNTSRFFGYQSDIKALSEQWRNNKFLSVTSAGYDEYYVINSKAMDLKQEDYQIDSNMTRSNIAKEFKKFSEKKSINRVLLSRFIDKISSNKKKVA